MDDDVKLLQRMYDRFNARDIDGVLIALTDDVAWANGMDGGHVHGREAIREYWTRQWAMISPHVEPVGFHRTADGAIVAEVRQSMRDLEGKPLEGQSTGLKTRRSDMFSVFERARWLASTSRTPPRSNRSRRWRRRLPGQLGRGTLDFTP
jgi:ketosteroid isomerase-like protein